MQRYLGFTLIEMAVVIAVIALLLGSILVPLATQIEERRIGETRQLLTNAREALLGFAVVNGRLPCPATAASNGVEQPPTGGICTAPYSGFLPAATLGLSPTDSQGFAIDPWGNRIRYAVTTAANNSNAFTSSGGVATAFSNETLSGPAAPDLRLCSTATGASGGNCAPGAALTTTAPAVVFSTGSNGGGGTGADEVENTNGDKLFISRTTGAAGSTEGAFDDIVVWISPHILYGRLVAAGKLP